MGDLPRGPQGVGGRSTETSGRSEAERADGASEIPVVLVPGAFGQDLLYWNFLRYHLERKGFPVHTLTFPRLTLSDLVESARQLADKIAEVRAAEDAPRVSIVSHSMGGLISRYYLRFLDGASATRVLVCLGVPHRGTVTAAGGAALKGARQALPGSPFLKKLNGGEVRHGVPVVNIYSSTDFVVVPQSSARLDAEDAVNYCAPLAGHWGLLVSRRVREWVTEALLAPPPNGTRTAQPASDEAGLADE